jgi:cyclase
MLAKRIIPCLDVKSGRVVKGVKFLNLQDAGDPVAQAAFYDTEGADEIIFLDITASAEDRSLMVDIAARTSERVFIPFTVGGGIRSVAGARKILKAGADKVSINTAAVKNPRLIRELADVFGSQCVVVAVDVQKKGSSWEVYINGGRTPTGRDVFNWVEEVQRLGAGELLLTSMDADGTQKGYDIQLNRRVARAADIPVIASGGAGSLADIYRVLTEGGADAALLASLLHYRKQSIRNIKNYLVARNVSVRTFG